MAGEAKFEHIRRFEEDLSRCTQCGDCTFGCPLYQEEPVEASVARGKVGTIRELLSTDGNYDCELCI